ncbi:MAG: RodZ domain-containing protein [Candidatus Omnitrophota bacterium]
MESAGERLKKIRLEKGISLEEVQKKTKIHLDILRAIEEDSLINLSPVYTKGFLKIYCKFLDQDPKDFMGSQSKPQSAQPPAKVSSSDVKKAEQPLFLKIALEKISSFKIKPIKIKPVVISVLAVLFIIGLFNLGKAISATGRKRALRKERQVKTETAKEKTDQPKKQQPAKVPTAPQQTVASAKTEPESGIRLGIIARENCYIPYLKTDGKTVFQGVLKKGRSETWQAKNKIEFSLGNAGAVDLEVNGRQIPSLGRRGQAVKNIVIDKEGLKTK